MLGHFSTPWSAAILYAPSRIIILGIHHKRDISVSALVLNQTINLGPWIYRKLRDITARPAWQQRLHIRPGFLDAIDRLQVKRFQVKSTDYLTWFNSFKAKPAITSRHQTTITFRPLDSQNNQGPGSCVIPPPPPTFHPACLTWVSDFLEGTTSTDTDLSVWSHFRVSEPFYHLPFFFLKSWPYLFLLLMLAKGTHLLSKKWNARTYYSFTGD